MGSPGALKGVLFAISGTLFNSLGLTLQRKYHFQANETPPENRLPYWRSPTWVSGITVFLCSQAFASLALGTLPTIVLAPLFASGLVFNAIFACVLVGESFGPSELVGTILCTIGAAIVSVAGYIPEQNLPLSAQLALLRRWPFVGLVLCQLLALVVLYVVARRWELSPGWGPRAHADTRFRAGVVYSVVSGVLCAASFLVGKLCVELVKVTLLGQGNQLLRPGSYIILALLLVIGAANVLFLNTSMGLIDVTLVGPLSYSCFLLVSLLNGIVFFDLSDDFSLPQLLALGLGTVLLLIGVGALSYPKQKEIIRVLPKNAPEETTELLSAESRNGLVA